MRRSRPPTAPTAVRSRKIALTPSGRLLDERSAAELAGEPQLALLCGRYEGFDERVVEHLADESISIGRYVLAGGELPAMVIADAVLRKLPGALGDAESAIEESYSEALEGAPEYPHYTRPATYRGWEVPEVLLSGEPRLGVASGGWSKPAAERGNASPLHFASARAARCAHFLGPAAAL